MRVQDFLNEFLDDCDCGVILINEDDDEILTDREEVRTSIDIEKITDVTSYDDYLEIIYKNKKIILQAV